MRCGVAAALTCGAAAQEAQFGAGSFVDAFADSPYFPKVIYDPAMDIDCSDPHYQCVVGSAAHCDGWPQRICASALQQTVCPGQSVCLHKSLFPMLPRDLLLYFTLFLIAIAASAAGIGGGGLNLPALMLLSGFDIKEAVPLSHSAVMGNALAQLCFNAPQRHPKAAALPLIHYELAFLLLPAMLGGSSLGVVFGRIFPPTVLVVLAVVMVGFAATKTAIKGFQVFRKEKQHALMDGEPGVQSLQPISADDERAKRLTPHERAPNQAPELGAEASAASISSNLSAAAADAMAVTAMRVPWNILALMIGFSAVTCVDQLLMSQDVFGTEMCSGLYWAYLIGLYPVVFATLVVGVRALKSRSRMTEALGGEALDEPIISARAAILFPMAALCIGLVAGLLGLGGGEFLVPLLLELGFLPRVASATSGLVIFFTTSSNIVHYLIAGTIQPSFLYVIGCFVVAGSGAVLGLVLRDTEYVQKRTYAVVFLLAGLLCTSSGLLAYRGFFVSAIDWRFGSFCGLGD